MNVQLGESLRRKALLASIAALAVTLPFSGLIQSWVLIACMLMWLLTGNVKEKLAACRNQRWIVLPLLLYVLACIGFFYSSNVDEASLKLTKKLALPLIPVFVASVWFGERREKSFVMRAFVFAALLSTFSNEARALVRYFSTNDIGVFLYAEYSFFLHPTYYAFVLSVALTWCLCKLIDNSNSEDVPRVFLWFAAAFLSLNILQASSRAGILGLAIVWFVVVLNLFQQRLRWSWRTIFGLVSLLVATVFTAAIFSGTLRLQAMTKAAETSSASPADTESSQTRLLIWKEALELVKSKPFFGYGTGDVNDVLNERYEKAGMKYARIYELNVHNQYLQEAISNGMVATVILVLWLMYGVVVSWRHKEWTALAFYLLAGFNLMFESMFERREGLFMIVFLTSLFLAQMIRDDYEKTNSPSRNSTRSDTPFS